MVIYYSSIIKAVVMKSYAVEMIEIYFNVGALKKRQGKKKKKKCMCKDNFYL
jgi:hypothetical protein